MRRILVIDDDEMILQTMQDLLADEGFDVLATADGPRALDIVQNQRPNLVLLDLALPSMNGLEVLRHIRDIQPATKVIVITGYGSEESSLVALRYGALDFLGKPVETKTLLEKIHLALDS